MINYVNKYFYRPSVSQIESCGEIFIIHVGIRTRCLYMHVALSRLANAKRVIATVHVSVLHSMGLMDGKFRTKSVSISVSFVLTR